jgi:hypothetical protein
METLHTRESGIWSWQSGRRSKGATIIPFFPCLCNFDTRAAFCSTLLRLRSLGAMDDIGVWFSGCGGCVCWAIRLHPGLVLKPEQFSNEEEEIVAPAFELNLYKYA